MADHSQFRAYLLGLLPEERATELDSRLFAEKALQFELEAEQESLVEEFVRGSLTPEEAAAFGAQCSRSPLLRGKVDSLQTLFAALERQKSPSGSSRGILFHWPAVPKLAACALAVALCIVGGLGLRQLRKSAKIRIASQTLPHAPQPGMAPASGEEQTFVAFLSADVPRGERGVPEITIPPGVVSVELQLELHRPPGDGGAWDVAIQRGDTVVSEFADLPLQRIGQETFLTLNIKPADLKPGSYFVRWASSSTKVPVQTRAFRVR